MNSPIRILYVDDARLDRELVRDALMREHGGFEVVEAATPEEFNDQLGNGFFDLVLTDFNILGFEGLQVIDAVRWHDPAIPVVIVTGTGSEEVAVEAMKRGADDYVIKTPQHIQRLSITIQEVIARRRLRAEGEQAQRTLAERAALATFVAEVGLALAESASLADMALRCAERIAHHLQAGYVTIWAAADRGNFLELIGHVGASLRPADRAGRLALDQADWGDLLRRNTVYHTDALADDPVLRDKDWAHAEGLRAFAGYPLRVEQTTVGLLALFLAQPLSELARDALKVVADHLAVGIQRQRAEEQLRDSEEQLRHILQTAADAVVMMNQQGRITFINTQAEQVFGYAPAELIGEELETLVPSTLREAHRRHRANFLAAPRMRPMGIGGELMAQRKDGYLFPVEISLSPLQTKEGLLVTAIIRDITERHQAAQAIRQWEEQLRLALAAARMGTWEWDLGADRVSWSPELATILGRQPDESSGTIADVLSLLFPPDRAWITQKVEALRLEPRHKDHFDIEARVQRPDGELVWLASKGRIFRDEAGEAVRIVGVGMDVSQRRRLQEQLLQVQKMEAFGQLAGGVAHDFNNLLTIVIGYSEILLESISADNPCREPIVEIRNAADRAAALIRQLLALSRKQILAPQELNLNNLVSDTEKLLRRYIGKDIRLIMRLAPDLGLVMADPNQMRQVLVNLAMNARDAMPQGGDLVLETRNVDLDETYCRLHPEVRPGAFVQLTVRDSGCGMDADVKAHIFEPFFTTKEVGKGNGLGMATVYGIIKQSDGAITVESEPGHGTTFHIYLPQLHRPDPREQANVMQSPTFSGTETILLVEDEPGIRELTRVALAAHGYTVLEAGNGPEALTVVQHYQETIHLLLTDVIMPRMNGRELADALLQQRPDLKVIFMSGYTDDAVVRYGLNAFGAHFLQKPFTPMALLRLLREVLDAM
ncbi:MAG: response regulator [Gemmataceae bacterium]